MIYVNLRTGKSHRVINGSALCGATLAGSAPSRHVPDVSCKLCRRIEAGMVKTAPTRVDYREAERRPAKRSGPRERMRMTKTYDTLDVRLYGWFDGEDDCEPPEPDKRWMTLAFAEDDGGMGDEIATFVQRKRGGEYRDDDTQRVENYAGLVLDAMKNTYGGNA